MLRKMQVYFCYPYGLRIQEQQLFLVCSIITIFTSGTSFIGVNFAIMKQTKIKVVPEPLGNNDHNCVPGFL